MTYCGPELLCVWHPLLIAAANTGGWERFSAALAARQGAEGGLVYIVDRWSRWVWALHPDAAGAAELATSPFPLDSSFGLLPYAAFRGHGEIVAGFCAVGTYLEGTAEVRRP